MATSPQTFIETFNNKDEEFNNGKNIEKIVIPMIQRDYAQGRDGDEANRVRVRFLEALYDAVAENPITLDFIYGDIKANGVMTPLDGQQRLTTLFLLHWYAAKRDNIEEHEYNFLNNFSYETRYSSREFCIKLVAFHPSFAMTIREEIIDQPWFPLDWLKDQTVSSMLIVIDAIHERFFDVPNLWKKLRAGAISFHFLPIKDMDLTDELYIKMNSRGKPLTQFEHFKAELERNLREFDPNVAYRILEKIDVAWTDMLWEYKDDNKLVDDEFLRYFRFICDVLCYRLDGSPQGKSDDEFDLLKEYFGSESKTISENITVLEQFFDCWVNIDESSPSAYLEKYMSYEYEHGKIRVERRYQIDIFEDCLKNYADIVGGRNRKFPLNRIVLLYSIITYMLNRNSITEEDFCRRLRIINNLIRNSEDEISDSVNRVGGNRMPAILRQVDSIIKDGVFDDNAGINFNSNQIEEEKDKLEWCKDTRNDIENMFELEDHPLLYGQIGIIGLDHALLFPRFKSLFECNWDKIDCALNATGDYVQTERNKWRFQMGTSKGTIDTAWRDLFHVGSNTGYEKTREVLCKLLSKSDSFTDDILQNIANAFIDECEEQQEYCWRYYYIKYPSFRPGRYGKYSWRNYEINPYEMLALWAKEHWSTNSRQPFLHEIDGGKINKGDCGWSLLYENLKVKCLNSAFVVCDAETDEVLNRVEIAQSDAGIDIEDRINKGKKIVAELLSNN